MVSRNTYDPTLDTIALDSLALITLTDKQCLLDFQAAPPEPYDPAVENPETVADIVITSPQTNPIDPASLQEDELLKISDDLGVLESLTSEYEATGFEICYTSSLVIYFQMRYGVYDEATRTVSNVKYGARHGTEPDENGVSIFCDIRNNLAQQGGLRYILVDQSPSQINKLTFVTQGGLLYKYGRQTDSTVRTQVRFEPGTAEFGGLVSESVYSTSSGLTFLDSIATHQYDASVLGPLLDQAKIEREQREADEQAERDRLAAEEEERQRQEAEQQAN